MWRAEKPHTQSYNITSILPGKGSSIRAELQGTMLACETPDIVVPLVRTKTRAVYTDSEQDLLSIHLSPST
jgi:hypothetical protein